ncbi:hypothetical protein AOC36_08805 [Erysipelothrix larvae]|uniref:CarD-like/TRCF RNAP-interacting domain-containing protein n=1 Tax=Erysipelothrix larvae TaxID=1514105 RepID=A0A109UHG7_9FIRM|nr:CarD family transcriptional regulator [Erysipelothrix larvae]AMC94083.1 hypothetical protein AOC36_08805 [Erysipelothrix larvae]
MIRNDYLFHVGYGLCRVIGEVTKNVNGKIKQYLKLQDVQNEDTYIYVPIDQIDDRTRPFAKPEVMKEHLDAIISTPYRQEAKYHERWKKISNMVALTDLEERFDLLIYLHDGKVRNEKEERSMPKRERVLYEKAIHQLAIEAALALHLDLSDATKYLNGQLKKRSTRLLNT